MEISPISVRNKSHVVPSGIDSGNYLFLRKGNILPNLKGRGIIGKSPPAVFKNKSSPLGGLEIFSTLPLGSFWTFSNLKWWSISMNQVKR